MPQALSTIVVNNGAATPVAKTFTLYTPGSDTVPAEYKLKEGSISGVFPSLTVMAKKTSNASRKASIRIRVPSSYTDSVTGLTKVGSAYEFNGTVSVPDDFPEALKNDGVAFVANIMNHPLIKEVMRDALSLT